VPYCTKTFLEVSDKNMLAPTHYSDACTTGRRSVDPTLKEQGPKPL
jgi:hypothetical protein